MNKQNTIPEIKGGDLIEINGEIHNVKTITEAHLSKYRLDEKDKLYYYEDICSDDYYDDIFTVRQGDSDITTVYRKQGKDYICIWGKEIGNG